MARAIPWPCCGPKTSLRRMRRSSVPCSRTSRSCSFRVDMRQEYWPSWVVCQPKRKLEVRSWLRFPGQRDAVAGDLARALDDELTHVFDVERAGEALQHRRVAGVDDAAVVLDELHHVDLARDHRGFERAHGQ